MAGLVWAGMMEGLGRGMTNVGNDMSQERVRAAEAAERERIRKQELEARQNFQREMAGDRMDFQRDMQDDRLAARGGSGGSGSRSGSRGGGGAGEPNEELLAAQMNMSVPELQRFRNAQRTGDNSAFMVDQPAPTGGVDEPQFEGAPATKGLPAGFDSFMQQKRQQFATLGAEQHYGKDLDGVVKGRRGMQEIEASQAVLRDPSKAGMVAKGMAAGEGKDLYGGNESGTYDKFTGEQTTGAVGQSKIRENDAQATKHRADAAKTGSESKDPGKDAELKVINSGLKAAGDRVESARKQLQALTSKPALSSDTGHAEAVKAARAELAKAMEDAENWGTKLNGHYANNMTRGTGSGTQPGEPGSVIDVNKLPPLPEPKNAGSAAKPGQRLPGDSAKAPTIPTKNGMPAPVTQEEYAKITPGTRYLAPNGQVLIKK